MFQTTNQITIMFPLLLVYSLLTTINHYIHVENPTLCTMVGLVLAETTSLPPCAGIGSWPRRPAQHSSARPPAD